MPAMPHAICRQLARAAALSLIAATVIWAVRYRGWLYALLSLAILAVTTIIYWAITAPMSPAPVQLRIPPSHRDNLEAIRTGLQRTPATTSNVTVERPWVVCLCGSTRFSAAFAEANLRETLAGRIVLTIGCDTRSDNDLWADPAERDAIKARLDALHLRKIDLADEILVLNVGGYIGESTRREIAYARQCGVRIRYLEPPDPTRCAPDPAGQATEEGLR